MWSSTCIYYTPRKNNLSLSLRKRRRVKTKINIKWEIVCLEQSWKVGYSLLPTTVPQREVYSVIKSSHAVEEAAARSVKLPEACCTWPAALGGKGEEKVAWQKSGEGDNQDSSLASSSSAAEEGLWWHKGSSLKAWWAYMLDCHWKHLPKGHMVICHLIPTGGGGACYMTTSFQSVVSSHCSFRIGDHCCFLEGSSQ